MPITATDAFQAAFKARQGKVGTARPDKRLEVELGPLLHMRTRFPPPVEPQ